MTVRFLVAFGLFASQPCLAAGLPAIEMVISCQQNLSDGRILVDGTMLPTNARYTVRQYTPRRSEAGWSYGECRDHHHQGRERLDLHPPRPVLAEWQAFVSGCQFD